MYFWCTFNGFLMDFCVILRLLSGLLRKSWILFRKSRILFRKSQICGANPVVPWRPQADPGYGRILPISFQIVYFHFRLLTPILRYYDIWKILENYMKNTWKICQEWAQNRPFELSAGHREHREGVRSLNFIQFEPLKTPPGLKYIKNQSKQLLGAVS